MPVDNYSINSPDFKDVENDVLKLWENNGYKNRKKLLDWAYGECQFKCPMHSSFFVVTHDHSVVGCCGMVERRIKMGEKIYTGAYPNNFLIDKHHRSLGPALKVQKNVLTLGNYQLVYAIPNAKSDGVLKRAGYKQIGKMERWVLVLKTEKYLRKIFKHPVFLRFIAVIADFLLSAKYLFKGVNNKHISVEIIDNFDKRFDEFWEKAKSNYAVIGERSAEYLNWRFKNYPLIDYKIFVLQDLNRKLIAYLVFFESKSVLVIEDLFARTEKDYVYILEQFLRYAKKQSSDAISIRFFGKEKVFGALDNVGFKKRSDSNSVLVFSKRENNKIYNKDNWFLTAADMDV
jgi:hypothetical protein